MIVLVWDQYYPWMTTPSFEKALMDVWVDAWGMKFKYLNIRQVACMT